MSKIYLGLFLCICVTYVFLIYKKDKRYEKIFYVILMTALWLILVLRYGQGSDYFGYNYLFERFSSIEIAITNSVNEHGEIGFRLLCAVFPWSFPWFIALVSTFEMIMLDRFLRKFSTNPILSLLLFYPTYYLTYYVSAIRQGIVIALFIGVLLEWLENKKWIRYYLVSLLALTIHSCAAVLLIIPFIKYIRLKEILVIDMICFAIGVILSTGFGVLLIQSIPQLQAYATGNVSIMALVERMVMFGILMLLYFYRGKYLENKQVYNWIKIYAVGVGIYLLFLAFPLISSRFMVIFKVLEIIIIPKLLEGRSKYRHIITVFLVLFTTLMTCKNLHSYIEQGDYFEEVKYYNYPYISIFNQEEIWEYREESMYWPYLESLK